MNENIVTSSFQFSKPLTKKDISEITHLISELEGVNKVNGLEQEVTIIFNGYVQTEEVLRKKLENAGYKLLHYSNQRKGWFRKFVDYIARGNKKAFKGGEPDCCNANIPE